MLIYLVLAIAGVFVLLLILAALSRSGQPPGLVQGQLAVCPDRPNCVSSQMPAASRAYVAPLPWPQDPSLALRDLLTDVVTAAGGEVHHAGSDFVAARFVSAIFRFRDDLELLVDRQRQVIHVRSASRVGYSDGGANRRRVEQLRALYLSRLAAIDAVNGG